MTSKRFCALSILLVYCGSFVQAQEAGSQEAYRILYGSNSAGPAIEKGSAAEARILSGEGDRGRIMEAGRAKLLRNVTSARRQHQRRTSY